jgi:hypothetical protein
MTAEAIKRRPKAERLVPVRRARLAGWLLPPLCGVLLALASWHQARAQAYPPILPQREVSVSYAFDSSQTGPMRIAMWADPAERLMRIDLGQGGDYLLLDFQQDRVRLVAPHKGFIFAVAPAGLANLTLGPASHLDVQRAGERQVAGVDCRIWHASGRDGSGEACITHDGVILQGRAGGTLPASAGSAAASGQSDSAHLKAIAVSYAAIPRDVFAVPPGMQEVDLPPALFRAMVPGLSGLSAP